MKTKNPIFEAEYISCVELMKDFFNVHGGFKGDFSNKSLITNFEPNDPRCIKITLKTHGTQHHYAGLSLQIIHKLTGVIDTHYFPFQDHLINRELFDVPYVWFHGKTYKWMNMPTKDSVFDFIDSIDNYLSHFKIND